MKALKNGLYLFLLLLAGGLLGSVIFSPFETHAAYQRNTAIAYTASQTVGSPEFAPQAGHTRVSVFVEALDNGTFIVQRKNSAGDWNAVSATITHAAGVEDWVVLDGPQTTLRVNFTDTSATTGSYYVEWRDGGMN